MSKPLFLRRSFVLPLLITTLLTAAPAPSSAQLEEERIERKRQLLGQCSGGLSPELRETLARTVIVDDHAHVFNLLYLPVEGIFHRYGLPPLVAGPLAGLFEGLTRRGPLGGGNEEMAGQSERTIGDRLDANQRRLLEDLEPKMRKALRRIQRETLGDQIDQLPGGSEIGGIGAEGPAGLDLALELLATAMEPEITETLWTEPQPEAAGALGGFFSLIGNLLRREDDMVAKLMEDHPLVDLFTHHMMDLEYIYTTRPEYRVKECRQPCEESTGEDPLERVTELGALEPRLSFSVAYDPFRGPAAFDHVKRGLDQGAVAVKLYPPSGYRPAANEIPPKPSCFKPSFPFLHLPITARRQVRKQWKSRYAGLDAKALDGRLTDLFELTQERGVPVFSHHTPAGFEALGRDGKHPSYGEQMAAPCHWLPILEENPGFHLVLSHSGGGEGWFNDDDWNGSFDQQAYNLCVQYPNVYCDFGHLQEILDSKNRETLARRLQKLVERPVDPTIEPGDWSCETKHDAPARLDLRDKLLYGSDWHLMSRIPDQEQLACRFAEVFDHSDALREGAARFFGDNAREVFGLEHP